MAIEYLAGGTYTGISAYTKPTADVLPGARFVETDTGQIWVFNGIVWLEIPLDHVNIIPPSIHVPYNFVYPDYATMIAGTFVLADEGKFIRIDDTNDIYMLTNYATPAFVKVSGSGTGEPNTASNIGTAGVGVFKQKTGVNLEFKKINAGSSKITVTNDAPNNEVDIDLNPAAVGHNNLGGIGVNDHHNQIHAATHTTGGNDKIDGDTVNVDYAPVNYSPSTLPAEVTQSYELTAHLAGIDSELGVVVGRDDGNKTPVRLATVAALPAYTPLGSGIGKKLEGNAVGALVVDGIGVVFGNRILVKNEVGAAAIHNGIYVVDNPGDGSNEYVLTRAVDYDQDSEIVPAHLVQSQEGNTNADMIWVLTTNAPIVLESSYLYYDSIKIGVTSVTTITPGENATVDSILLSEYHTAKWLVEIYDSTADEREASEIIAREKSLNVIWAQPVDFKIGDAISYTISFSSNGVSMLFKILNNESNNIVVRLRRLEV